MTPAKVVSDPRELEAAWEERYSRLAQIFARMLPKRGTLVELGCGRGQLTIPLIERLSEFRVLGVDNFRGPYSGSRARLVADLAHRGKRSRVDVIVADCRAWLKTERDSRFGSIISSEFLPELDARETRDLFIDCYRILKPGGTTVHSFLSPEPRNERQRRLIEADSNPRWTMTPPAEWFSPPPKTVRQHLKSAGFSMLSVARLRSRFVIKSQASKQLLKDWDVRQSFWKSNKLVLEKEGLEIPDWLIISGVKTR